MVCLAWWLQGRWTLYLVAQSAQARSEHAESQVDPESPLVTLPPWTESPRSDLIQGEGIRLHLLVGCVKEFAEEMFYMLCFIKKIILTQLQTYRKGAKYYKRISNYPWSRSPQINILLLLALFLSLSFFFSFLNHIRHDAHLPLNTSERIS